MQEERNDYIIYDDGWQNVSTPEYPSTADEFEEGQQDIEVSNDIKEKRFHKKENSPRQLVVLFQLIICLLIGLAGFVLKSLGGEIYANARGWYYSALNNSVIYEDKDIRLDINKLFGEASADEA